LISIDDCRQSDGTRVEIKGHYEGVMQNEIIGRNIDKEWVDQARKQVKASGGFPNEWIFLEQAAADHARELFKDEAALKNIKLTVMPYPPGVPKYNPRIKTPDDYKAALQDYLKTLQDYGDQQ
jgi:hypothetical protein